MEAVVVDPWVDAAAAAVEYDLTVLKALPQGEPFAAVIAAVAHRQFAELDLAAWQLLLASAVVFDLKGIIPRDLVTLRL